MDTIYKRAYAKINLNLKGEFYYSKQRNKKIR